MDMVAQSSVFGIMHQSTERVRGFRPAIKLDVYISAGSPKLLCLYFAAIKVKCEAVVDDLLLDEQLRVTCRLLDADEI